MRVVICQGSEAASRRTRRLHAYDASMVWVRMRPDDEPDGLRWKVFAQSDPQMALANWDPGASTGRAMSWFVRR